MYISNLKVPSLPNTLTFKLLALSLVFSVTVACGPPPATPNSVTNTFLSPNIDTTHHIDNFVIQSTVSHNFDGVSQLLVSAWADNQEVARQIINTTQTETDGPYLGVFNMQATWPINTADHNLTLKFCDPATGDCLGANGGDGEAGGTFKAMGSSVPATATKQRLSPEITLRKVWFHHITDGSSITLIPDSWSRPLVDGALMINGSQASNVDLYFTACSDQTRTQFRFERPEGDTPAFVSSMTVNMDNPGWQTEFRNYVDAVDPDDEYLHVFYSYYIVRGGVNVYDGWDSGLWQYHVPLKCG